MKYIFDVISQRRHTASIKWDVKENELPMWVADMDFMVMPEIQEAIINSAKNGSYGYTYPTEEFFASYQYWWKSRHNLDIDTKAMVFVSGVVSALDSLVRVLTKENDHVMILTPVYHVFFSVIENNKRVVTSSELKYEDDDYHIDYQDVEEKIIKDDVKLLIFCNPHNPVGKIWNKEEIEKMYAILNRHGVKMISDEIHCDIVEPGYHYVPALAISPDIITCLAPSKVFNLAGLHAAVTVVNNPHLKEQIQAAYYRDDVGEITYFAVPATIVAYRQGGQFVDELNEYLLKNKQYVHEYLEKNLPHIKLMPNKATYLLWLDISYYKESSDVFAKKLREKTGLFVSDGLQFGGDGANYIRMNIATNLETVKEGMKRLADFLKDEKRPQ